MPLAWAASMADATDAGLFGRDRQTRDVLGDQIAEHPDLLGFVDLGAAGEQAFDAELFGLGLTAGLDVRVERHPDEFGYQREHFLVLRLGWLRCSSPGSGQAKHARGEK